LYYDVSFDSVTFAIPQEVIEQVICFFYQLDAWFAGSERSLLFQ